MPDVEYLGILPKLYCGACPSVPTAPPMPEEYLYAPPTGGTDCEEKLPPPIALLAAAPKTEVPALYLGIDVIPPRPPPWPRDSTRPYLLCI